MPASASPSANNDKMAHPPPLNPPKFSALPDDIAANPDRYELWSIRIPSNIDPVQLLDGKTIELRGLGGGDGNNALGSIVSSAFGLQGGKEGEDGGDEDAESGSDSMVDIHQEPQAPSAEAEEDQMMAIRGVVEESDVADPEKKTRLEYVL